MADRGGNYKCTQCQRRFPCPTMADKDKPTVCSDCCRDRNPPEDLVHSARELAVIIDIHKAIAGEPSGASLAPSENASPNPPHSSSLSQHGGGGSGGGGGGGTGIHSAGPVAGPVAGSSAGPVAGPSAGPSMAKGKKTDYSSDPERYVGSSSNFGFPSPQGSLNDSHSPGFGSGGKNSGDNSGRSSRQSGGQGGSHQDGGEPKQSSKSKGKQPMQKK